MSHIQKEVQLCELFQKVQLCKSFRKKRFNSLCHTQKKNQFFVSYSTKGSIIECHILFLKVNFFF